MTTSPDSTTETDEPLIATVPGFRPPPSPPGPDPLDPDTTTLSDPTTPDAGPEYSIGPGPDELSDVAAASSSRTTSSPASTADPLAFVEIARTVVGLAAMVVRAVRARRRPWLHPAAWIATPDDQAAIGDPLGRIAARHAPVTGEGSADVADGMAAMIGAAGYAVRGLTLEAEGLTPDVETPAGAGVDQPAPAEAAAGPGW